MKEAGRSYTHHMCVSIEGVLCWPTQKLNKLFTNDDGTKPRGSQARDWLKLQLAQGKKVLPMGKACEGFSYQTGCPGHIVPTETEKAEMNKGDGI